MGDLSLRLRTPRKGINVSRQPETHVANGACMQSTDNLTSLASKVGRYARATRGLRGIIPENLSIRTPQCLRDHFREVLWSDDY